MTNEMLNIGTSLGVGLLLGLFFFGGLWWTVQKGIAVKQPALWFLASQIIRTSVVIFGFYILGDGQSLKLVSGLLGFLFARLSITHYKRTIRHSIHLEEGD